MRAEELDLEIWSELPTGARDRIASDVAARLGLEARGFKYAGVRAFAAPSAGSPSECPVWFDAALGMHWVLIPGGRFRSGYSGRQLEKLAQEAQSMSGAALAPDTESPSMDAIAPYGARDGWSPNRLRAGQPIRVGPLLMAALPVLQCTPGVEKVIDTQAVRLCRFDAQRATPLSIRPSELPELLQQYNWDLPTIAELEWALKGGREALFPWGDDLPTWLHVTDEGYAEVMRTVGADPSPAGSDGRLYSDTLDAMFDRQFPLHYTSATPDWTHANPFGVVDGNVSSAWAAGEAGLCWFGGAAECYPWQGCGEWANFLTAAWVSSSPRRNPFTGKPVAESHPLRPIIRIEEQPEGRR